jgi:hypothetical protein
MRTYKNDYTKKEDYALWELHEIRNKMAQEKLDPDKINENARKIIKSYQLKNFVS